MHLLEYQLVMTFVAESITFYLLHAKQHRKKTSQLSEEHKYAMASDSVLH